MIPRLSHNFHLYSIHPTQGPTAFSVSAQSLEEREGNLREEIWKANGREGDPSDPGTLLPHRLVAVQLIILCGSFLFFLASISDAFVRVRLCNQFSYPRCHCYHYGGQQISPPHHLPRWESVGLSDEARADFGIMKDVSAHTRVSPASRHERMIKFMQDIRDKQVAQQQLSRWGLKFAEELLQVKARILAPEKIFQRKELAPYKPTEAEW